MGRGNGENAENMANSSEIVELGGMAWRICLFGNDAIVLWYEQGVCLDHYSSDDGLQYVSRVLHDTTVYTWGVFFWKKWK